MSAVGKSHRAFLLPSVINGMCARTARLEHHSHNGKRGCGVTSTRQISVTKIHDPFVLLYLIGHRGKLHTETTQIWGKEFPGRMYSMKPENSSFLSSVTLL